MSAATPSRTPLEIANESLHRETPALAAALSPLGRRVVFPPDIPFQAAQARGKKFNATLGQITDGAGGAVRLPSLAENFEGLPEDSIDRALLYSPVQGIEELRELWRDRQRRLAGVGDDVPSSLPVVTVGLTHGLSIVADLFAGEGRAVAVPAPFWGNYRQAFATRTGAHMVSAPFYEGGVFAPDAVSRALADEPEGRPAVAILNFPSNPHGYMPSEDERSALKDELVREAEKRPLVALCDDAYAGLVFDDEVPRRSLFWDLIGAHPELVPVKIDGATKEVSYFGGRVGFITFAVPRDGAAAQALESKVKCLVRATMGSPVATSQVMLLEALRSETLEDEIEDLRLLLARRARTLARTLDGVDRSILRPLPMNSGCFALTEIPEELGITSEEARLHLLEHEDAGVVAIAPRYLRIAFCSVSEETLPELVERVERGVRELAQSRA